MRNARTARHTLPTTRRLTIIAQDPSIKIDGHILTAEVEVPAEELADGPCGYRVNVIDYDSAANVLYEQATFPPLTGETYEDPFGSERRKGKSPASFDKELIGDPKFHAQNAYAIVMRTLARFEFALGRRVCWGCDGHQIHVAPHAFADANAYYSRDDRGIFFGYFNGRDGGPIFTCLSHDVIAHETTHALLDGLRSRYMEPSSPDQAAFHEGFADVVALLSIFSLPEVVGVLLGGRTDAALIDETLLTREELSQSVLMGLADEMGSELSGVRGRALRNSVELTPGQPYATMPEFQEEHRRGELIVAAMMNAFLRIWLKRLERVGFLRPGKKDRSLVVEEAAQAANHLLTMAIRAIDYCPPVDLTFSDYLSALLTVDQEVVPDDSRYRYREALLESFRAYGIERAESSDPDGTWAQAHFKKPLVYSRTRFDSMLRDREEVFRFIWENRDEDRLGIHKDGYVEVQSVRPCTRIGPDGFVLRETVAEYVQILTLRADELQAALGIKPSETIPEWRRVRIFGGGALIFDEYGQLKYQIANCLEHKQRQQRRLDYLAEVGFFDREPEPRQAAAPVPAFARLHLARATG